MKKLFSPSPLWPDSGLAFIRIIVGGFMIYHGWEVFDEAKMKPYFDWDAFKGFSSPAFIVYFGKTAELVAGIFLTIGFFYQAFFIGSYFLFFLLPILQQALTCFQCLHFLLRGANQ